MVEKKIKRLSLWVVMIAVVSVLIIILYSNRKVEKTLEQEMIYTLEDIANQNDIVVKKEITAKYNLLFGMVSELQQGTVGDLRVFLEHARQLAEVYDFMRIGFAGSDGMAYTTDGYEKNIEDMGFFQLGMQGENVMTDVMTDQIADTQEQIITFAAPVYDKNDIQIKGVAFCMYCIDEFSDILNIECFDDEGYAFITNESGDIIINSSKTELAGVANIFDELERFDGNHSEKQNIQMIRADMEQQNCSHGVLALNGKQYYCLTPLLFEETAEKWYMMTIVPEEILQERLKQVKQVIHFLLMMMIIIMFMGIVFYIYSYKKRKGDLYDLAYSDDLTGGANYAYFKKKIKAEKELQGYLLTMDINEFKIVNSTCGTKKGDEAICHIWEVLKQHIKEKELAAHMNADSFVMLLLEDEKERVVERISEISSQILALSDRWNIPKLFPVFGIYYMEKDADMEQSYSCAMEAKRLMKGRRDRNYAFYEEVDKAQMLERRKMEDSFEEALAEHHFEVWYQPKYGTQRFEVVGSEALIRWRKKDGTLVPPGKFIPLFEQNGMIARLDEYTFREVCRQQKEWEKEGKEMYPVSVNISRASLYFGDIVDKYRSIIDAYQLSTEYVELEITESAMIDNANISNLIAGFHQAGFRLLLDDFGNGYSSLASLNSMHFDTLKLDKSLVDYIGDKKGETLLYYITGLAQNLGLMITAEGVETKEQVAFIQKLKCTDIQGFYFSKPLPLCEYEQLL